MRVRPIRFAKSSIFCIINITRLLNLKKFAARILYTSQLTANSDYFCFSDKILVQLLLKLV